MKKNLLRPLFGVAFLLGAFLYAGDIAGWWSASIKGWWTIFLIVPGIAGMFLYIFCMNFLGLVPGFDAPTANLNSTVCMALFVFVLYNIVGIIRWKGHYINQFTGPSKVLIPLMLPLEMVSHLARPLSLSLRLFGNIRGEEIVMILFFSMAPILSTVPIYALFLLGKTMQAFVFFMLTMFYLKSALEGPEH